MWYGMYSLWSMIGTWLGWRPSGSAATLSVTIWLRCGLELRDEMA